MNNIALEMKVRRAQINRQLALGLCDSANFCTPGGKRSRKKHVRWLDIAGWLLVAGLAFGYLAASTH